VSPALASTRADRVAAADAFANRTRGLERQLLQADKRAVAAREARRAAAQSCADVFKSAPPMRREDLKTIYFEHLVGGLWSVDAPIYGSWVSDLRRSKRIDRSPVLARGADALRTELRLIDAGIRRFVDACAIVTRWRDAGWTDAARPSELTFSDGFQRGEIATYELRIQAARNQVRRYAHHPVSIGIDEVDARVHATEGCDAIGKLLFPDDYEC
jgi:hypothetical protein